MELLGSKGVDKSRILGCQRGLKINRRMDGELLGETLADSAVWKWTPAAETEGVKNDEDASMRH